jgi:large subunit ribosomal protein L1
MSKTSQENKAKKAKQKSVEVQNVEGQTPKIVEGQKAVVESTPAETSAVVAETPVETTPTKLKVVKIRGKKYLSAKKKIDVTKYYPLKEAVKLVKETSFSKFDGKVEAHVTVLDIGNVGEITFPHLESIGKKVVVLNDTILAEIKDGKVNFDILIASPSTMPKLLPFAKTLGPKGLMPNPKNGTLTDDTESAVKKLSVAKTVVKTEKKSPVVHIIVGKVSQPVEELTANIDELIKVIKSNKIKKLALCATMGPCVKVEVK